MGKCADFVEQVETHTLCLCCPTVSAGLDRVNQRVPALNPWARCRGILLKHMCFMQANPCA